jgi:hypothetical protein
VVRVPGGVAALALVVGLAVLCSPGLRAVIAGRDPVDLAGTADRAGPPSAAAVVQRWAAAFDGIHALRGTQQFAVVLADGTHQPLSAQPSADPRGGLRSVDEVDERQAGGTPGRYRMVAHYAIGDEITLWDGMTASRYRSWVQEVNHPLPQSYAAGAYWVDDLDDLSLLSLLRPVQQAGSAPSGEAYDVLGSRVVDGRSVLELRVKPGWRTAPAGMEGTLIELDPATSLPVRVVAPPQLRGADQLLFERRVTNLEVNPTLGAADFGLALPADTVTVFEQAPFAPRIERYASAQEAARQAGFSLYLPQGHPPGEIYAMYLVERLGRRSPVVAIDFGSGVSLLEGRYLPRWGRPALDARQVGQPEVISLDGQPATLRLGPFGWGALTFERQGTWIELSGTLGTRDQALQLAGALQPTP